MKFFLHFYFYTNDGRQKKICLHFTEQRFEVLSGCSLCSVKFDGWNLKWIGVVSIFFLFRFFLIILNHTSQIFQSSSSHFLLFTPRRAKSQLKLIRPKKLGRGSALSFSLQVQAQADSADSISKPVQNKREIIFEKVRKNDLQTIKSKTSTVLDPKANHENAKR